MTNEDEYNLLDEPWIAVVMADGKYEKMGILDVFRNSGGIKRISGESSAQDIAIIRILLAILYATYAGDEEYHDMEEEEAVDLWKTIWDEGRFDMGRISAYLEQYRSRFFLFGKSPFYQAAISSGTEYSVMKLIGNVSESENKPRLFKPLSSASVKGVSYDEAARWLVYVNSYDDTSAKPKAKGTPSPGAGWLGKIGIVYAQGESLFETLMLNFVLLDEKGEPFDVTERPVWENPPCSDERIEVPKPGNQMRLFTIQSRRISLSREGRLVTGYVLLGGDVFDKSNVLAETMTMWRQDEKTGDVGPKRHTEGRALWRDFGVLTGSSGSKAAGVVRWAAVLKRHGAIDRKMSTFRADGLHFADKDFFVDGCFDDELVFNSSVLGAAFQIWGTRISSAISVTDECVSHLGFFVRNVLVCEGYDPKQGMSIISKRSGEIKTKAYHRLDSPLRNWLASIDPDKDSIDERIDEWYALLRKVVISEGDLFLSGLGERALVGRGQDDNAVSKYRLFVNSVYKTLRG